MTLDDVIELVTLAYFDEHQRAGLSWTALERRLGRSRRTIASLSKRLSESGYSIDGSAIFRTQRAVVEQLAESDLSRAELTQRMPDTAELELAVQALCDAETIIDNEGTLSLAASLVDQVGESFDERIDGLRHFMETVTHVAHQRFFSGDGEETVARTVVFSASRTQRKALGKVLFENIIAAVTAVDGKFADDAKEESSVIFSASPRPKGPAWNQRG